MAISVDADEDVLAFTLTHSLTYLCTNTDRPTATTTKLIARNVGCEEEEEADTYMVILSNSNKFFTFIYYIFIH